VKENNQKYLFPYIKENARKIREKLLKQRGCVLWLTGLSGSGKTTIAFALEEELFACGKLVYILDGDNIRCGLNSDLGFEEPDRTENIRRVAEVAALFADCGVIVITAFISPFRLDRQKAKKIIGKKDFSEIFIDAPIEICESRDPKGLYKKARDGLISNFTGLTSPYEPPEEPDILIRTDKMTVEKSVKEIINYLKQKEII